MQPANTRLPTLQEWQYLKKTQQFSGVYELPNQYGEREAVWFDVTADAPTE